MVEKTEEDEVINRKDKKDKNQDSLIINLTKSESIDLTNIKPQDLTPNDKKQLAARLKRRMQQAAKDLDYELAAILRDYIHTLEK